MTQAYRETIRSLRGELRIRPAWLVLASLALMATWLVWLTTPSLPLYLRTQALETVRGDATAPMPGAGQGSDIPAKVEIDLFLPPAERALVHPGQRAFVSARTLAGGRVALQGEVIASLSDNGARRVALETDNLPDPAALADITPLAAAIDIGAQTPIAYWSGWRTEDRTVLTIETAAGLDPRFFVQEVEREDWNEADAARELNDEDALLFDLPGEDGGPVRNPLDAPADLVAIDARGLIAAIRAEAGPGELIAPQGFEHWHWLLVLADGATDKQGISVGDRVWYGRTEIASSP